jgi:hypothetical protein
MLAVRWKVAGAPTAPAHKLSVTSLFHVGEGGLLQNVLTVVYQTMEGDPAAMLVALWLRASLSVVLAPQE